MARGFITFTCTINGVTQVERKLATWGHNIADLTPAWEQVGESMLDEFSLNMAEEGGRFGRASRWAPLAASTVAERQRLKLGGEHPILWRTGDLGMSLRERGAAGNVFQATPTGVTVGTSVAYAGYHQSGTRRMPARQIVGVSWRQKSVAVNILASYVRQQARAAGLQGGA